MWSSCSIICTWYLLLASTSAVWEVDAASGASSEHLEHPAFGSDDNLQQVASTTTPMASTTTRLHDKHLPTGPLIIAYQDWRDCDLKKTLTAVENGANVVVWFAINLLTYRKTWQPVIKGGPDYKCVAKVMDAIEERGLETSHLISIGGANSPHPTTVFKGKTWFKIWEVWNSRLPRPFDGFDWDLEGNSGHNSPNNTFTAEVLNLVVDMSVAAKERGFIVTMVPAQSYLDHTSSDFSLSLATTYKDWHPDFAFHGRNCYAYVLAVAPGGTFDAVTVQLYESWSRADQAVLDLEIPPEEYLKDLVLKYNEGWMVNFGMSPGLRIQGHYKVHVRPDKLVIGFSSGSKDGKQAFFWPESIEAAYTNTSLQPRGYSFWNIAMEGSRANGTNRTVSFASDLNKFLRIRNTTSTSKLSPGEDSDGEAGAVGGGPDGFPMDNPVADSAIGDAAGDGDGDGDGGDSAGADGASLESVGRKAGGDSAMIIEKNARLRSWIRSASPHRQEDRLME